jgi:hypothetical protein
VRRRIPYAPALDAHGWICVTSQLQTTANEGLSAEQCLRSGSCGAVLGWLQKPTTRNCDACSSRPRAASAAFLFRPARCWQGKSCRITTATACRRRAGRHRNPQVPRQYRSAQFDPPAMARLN